MTLLLLQLCHFGHTNEAGNHCAANVSERRVASEAGKSLRERQKSPQVGQWSKDLRASPTGRGRSVFRPSSRVFAAQWFLAESEQYAKVDLDRWLCGLGVFCVPRDSALKCAVSDRSR